MGRWRSAAGILGPVQRGASAGLPFAGSPDPELDRTRFWRYTKREGIPVIPLYLARDGQRYVRSAIATLPSRRCPRPVTIDETIKELETTSIPERAGRAMDQSPRTRSSACAPPAICSPKFEENLTVILR